MTLRNIIIFTGSIILILNCGCKKIQKPQAAIERENWIASFEDSVKLYKDKSVEIENNISSMQSILNTELESFEMVKKPREVSGYYILKGWNQRLPFTTTALYARINENEKLELIATLAGKTFNRISVGGVMSEIVPHDQAFNYRHERFNTVYFTGDKADSIAQYISMHIDSKLNLEFLEGAKKNNFNLPNDQKEMIAKTWNLYNTQLKIKHLQKELWLYSRKIETFRMMMLKDETIKN